MMYGLVDAHRPAFGVEPICRVLEIAWGATIILAGGATNMMAGGEESKAA